MFLGFCILKGIHTMIHAPAKPKLLVISGPSGSGKSTMLQKLFSEFPDKFGFSVSHQSRAPRAGEVDGVHYHFCTREKIEKMIENEEFLESAAYTNHLCGTSKAAVEKVWSENKICVLDIDTEGVRQLKSKAGLDPLFVFIKPPSLQILEKRLRDRKTDSEENIRRRLKVAESELEYASDESNFNLVIVNDDLEKAYTQLRDFIYEKYKNILSSKNKI
ncbi:uncharacterized protein LOC135842230 isoform X2 [Planococcus citri]|uniref:uncharacterized protein LOC135842230 isoform X2 n=1 Tax=Planococcus citri TaxID=170843 RepID=UPI0031F80677